MKEFFVFFNPSTLFFFKEFCVMRQKHIAHTGRQVFEKWLTEQSGVFEVQPSEATCIAFVRYHLPIRSFDFAERIRKEASVLVAPGSALGAEYHLRITLGYESEKIRASLERIGAVAAKIA